MSWLRTYIASRIRRGFTLRGMGPNEARVLYDAAVAVFAAILALVLCATLAGEAVSVRALAAAAVAAPLLVAINLAFGIYGRLRYASGRSKTLALALGVVATGALLALVAGIPFAAVWTSIAIAPVVLARLVLAVAQAEHRTPLAAAVNDRGPVLVIGGAGYIGSHTVEQLLAAGHSVRVLDKLIFGRSSLDDFRRNPRFSFIEGDGADISKLTEGMRGASAVVHLAGLVGDPACAVDPEFTRHTNVVLTRMVRQVAQAMGVRRFVFASSCSVYGASEEPVDERSALNPVSLYAQTKIDSERELLANPPDDFYITILRFATVFGHSRRPRFDLVANLFAAQAIKDGRITVIGPDQWRPFVHVRDLARAIVKVIEADAYTVQNEIFNVGDERLNTTILGLAQTVQKVASEYRPIEISVTENPDDRRNYMVSFEKIRKALGFRADTLLEDGVRELIERHRAGAYDDYRAEAYSNVAMTRRALERFQDPDELSRLYAPLAR